MCKKPTGKDKCTADILTVFKKTTGYIHLDTGKTTDGHFCLVCRYVFILEFNLFCNILPRDKGVREASYFFAGGISSLRTHIARYDTLSFHQL